MHYEIDCIVINLDRDKERWQKMHESLDVLGVSHRRFSAIDGKTIGDRYDALMDPIAKHLTCYGVLGCALSHKVALRDFLEHSDSPVCLLLEDDAVGVPDSAEIMQHLLKEAPDGWHMIKLSRYPNRKNGPPLIKNKFTVDACAQLISRAGAKKMTETKILFPSYPDITPWFIPGLEVYTARDDFKTFDQVWSREATGIHKGRYPFYFLNLKILRLGVAEFSYGDIFVFLLLALGVIVLLVLRYRKSIRKLYKIKRYMY